MTKMRLSWRILWYSVIIWVLAFMVSGVVVLPWFYLILPLVVLLATVYYLDQKSVPPDKLLAVGLGASIAWFFAIIIISTIELASLYYFNVVFFFSDTRNWLLYPLVLLVPVVYSIILDNGRVRKSKHKKNRAVSRFSAKQAAPFRF